MHYDVELSLELIDGFTHGFDLGFRGSPNSNLRVTNLTSCKENPAAVNEKILKELNAGRLLGPFDHPPFKKFQINPIGVVPKRDKDTFRLITHLSSPLGQSINDNIPQEYSHVNYYSIHDAVRMLISLGEGAFMAKADIKNAFRLIPIKESQQNLLGFTLEGKYYFDKCLPMGASSSCQLFEKFTTALQFIAERHGIRYIIHYLDDFLILNSNSHSCAADLESFIKICESINIPLAPEKTVYPSQVIQFLGIEIDSVKQQLILPEDKINKCKNLIQTMLDKDKCTLRELQSLMGLLNFACSVIIPGRAFLESIRILMKGLQKPSFKRRLNKQAKLDLQVWLSFLDQCNGVTIYKDELFISAGVLHIYTDSSQTIGLGAILGQSWLASVWPSDWWREQNITLLEFIPIVLAVHSWNSILRNKVVIFHTDNQSLVHVINRQHSDEGLVRVVLRGFVLSLLKSNILAKAEHIDGSINAKADEFVYTVSKSTPKGSSPALSNAKSASIARIRNNMDTLIKSALAPSTQQFYNRAWENFLTFTRLRSIDTDLPLSTDVILYYISYLQLNNKHFQSITPVLSAISYKHKLLDLQDPCKSFRVSQMLTSIKRNSTNNDKRLPITLTLLQKMLSMIYTIGLSDYETILLKAMFTFQFYFALRIGEITDSPHNISLQQIKAKKKHYIIIIFIMQTQQR